MTRNLNRTSPISPGLPWSRDPPHDDQLLPIHQLLEGMPDLDSGLLPAHKPNAPRMLGRSHSGGALIYIPPSLIKSKPTLEERLAMPDLSTEGDPTISKGWSSPTIRKTSCSSNIRKPLLARIGGKRKWDHTEKEEEEGRGEKRRLIDRIGGKWNEEPLARTTSLKMKDGPGYEPKKTLTVPIPVNRPHTRSLNSSTRTSRSPNDASELHQEPPKTFQARSGEISSGEGRSISTESSRANTYRNLCQRMSHAWGTLKSESLERRKSNEWRRAATGSSHGAQQRKQLPSPSLIDRMNLLITPTTCSKSSAEEDPSTMSESYSSMKRLEIPSAEEKTAPSLTQSCERTLPKVSFTQTGLTTTWPLEVERGVSAIISTVGTDVQTDTAHTNINARDVKRRGMDSRAAERQELRTRGAKPKYLRYNRWDAEGKPIPGIVEWTNEAEALPHPPSVGPEHEVMQTVQGRPDLFRIVTPIDVSLLTKLLAGHPNRAFTDSVCEGLRNGFWPWAELDTPGFPSSNDQAQIPTTDVEKERFLREQRDHEPLSQNECSGWNECEVKLRLVLHDIVQ